MEIEGSEEYVEKQLDLIGEWARGKKLRIVDYQVHLRDGSTGSMAKEGAACLDCGQPATTQFEKVEMAAGIAVSRALVTMCHHHFERFDKDADYRRQMWILGLQTHLVAQQ